MEPPSPLMMSPARPQSASTTAAAIKTPNLTPRAPAAPRPSTASSATRRLRPTSTAVASTGLNNTGLNLNLASSPQTPRSASASRRPQSARPASASSQRAVRGSCVFGANNFSAATLIPPYTPRASTAASDYRPLSPERLIQLASHPRKLPDAFSSYDECQNVTFKPKLSPKVAELDIAPFAERIAKIVERRNEHLARLRNDQTSLDPECTFTPKIDPYTLELASPRRLGLPEPPVSPRAHLVSLNTTAHAAPVVFDELEERRKAVERLGPPRPLSAHEFSPATIVCSGKPFMERIADYTRLHKQIMDSRHAENAARMPFAPQLPARVVEALAKAPLEPFLDRVDEQVRKREARMKSKATEQQYSFTPEINIKDSEPYSMSSFIARMQRSVDDRSAKLEEALAQSPYRSAAEMLEIEAKRQRRFRRASKKTE